MAETSVGRASVGTAAPGEKTASIVRTVKSPEEQDAARCRRVEDALYRRACGYKVKLKKSFKVKVVEYDPDTGKKATEREDLKDGFEEVHIPADVRVCAYYLNNRDPVRWQEHPKDESTEAVGMVDFPPLAEPEEV
jgi:hypothetical protein